MKTDLTSQIKLDRIPRRYYRPENEIERTAVTREEKVNTFIYESTADGGAFLASEIARYIRRFTAEKGKCVIALGAGNATHPAYAHLISMCSQGKVDFSNVVIYNISEFFPLNENGPSTLARLKEVLLDHINVKPENIRSIDPQITKETMFDCCRAYEDAIETDGGRSRMRNRAERLPGIQRSWQPEDKSLPPGASEQ